jgi:hypothetical protein
MKNITRDRGLDERIEQLVREPIASMQRNAREALERAFAGATSPRVGRRVTRGHGDGGRKRRAPTEVSAIGERLYRAVCARPGEGMGVLARELGASARELHRPMALLKKAGRVRSVGQRSLTRYFPRTGS